jgi:hypothetical protein
MMMMRSLILVVLTVALMSCSEPAPIEIEAENFARGNVVVDRITPNPNSFAEYDFEIGAAGNYQVELRYASTVPRPLKFLVDGKVVNPQAAATETGGFLPEQQKWMPAGDVELSTGRHVLRLECDGVFPHVDKIRIAKFRKIGS